TKSSGELAFAANSASVLSRAMSSLISWARNTLCSAACAASSCSISLMSFLASPVPGLERTAGIADPRQMLPRRTLRRGLPILNRPNGANPASSLRRDRQGRVRGCELAPDCCLPGQPWAGPPGVEIEIENGELAGGGDHIGRHHTHREDQAAAALVV